MKAIKYSRQRESVKACLMARKDHPTAEVIYASIREQYPNISLGTVYRNLNLLEELGEVRKLRCGNGPDHFDGDMAPHYHFLCKECGQVADMPMSHMEEINTLAGRYYPGRIENHETVFYGVCPQCLKLENMENISGKQVDKIGQI
ncbi:MAG: transcriptional repressor [Lachnospiraceae bacterium]|nr:transcriptional repressor [Lachnospiraceae bacterium]MCI9592080.1 transcriptional repressor [Lachnospiraceae bacterium]MDE6929178.1 transcriptional repressor [Lachnospiraceae bacterium]